MKKFYSFLVAAVLLMGATSCQKEATADAGAADNVEFVASIAGGRTELGAGNKVMWNANDNIRIFTQDNFAGTEFNSDATAATATAKFTTTQSFTASNNGYLAVYPETANTGNATCEDGVWSVPVNISGWDQNPVNYPIAFEKNSFMVAFSGDNQLSFKAATALLKIKNVDNSQYGEIHFSGDILGGEATLLYDTNTAKISYTLGNGDSMVQYSFLEQNGETIYIPIYPGTVTGFEVYGDDYLNPLVTYNKTITFEAGVIYDLDLDNAPIGGGDEGDDNVSPWKLFDSNTGNQFQMSIDENGYHVAKNVPFSEGGYYLMIDWMNLKQVSGEIQLNTWMELSDGMDNMLTIPTDYADIYMTEDCSMLCIVPAGENPPALPTYEPSLYGLMNTTTGSFVSMIIKDGFHYAKLTTSDWSEDSYLVVDPDGNGLGFTTQSAEPSTWYKTGVWSDASAWQPITIATYAGMEAQVYISADGAWMGVAYPGYALPAVPTQSAWCMRGDHNNWGNDGVPTTPMYDMGDYSVAYGVQFTAGQKFKFEHTGTWVGGVGTPTVGEWNYTGGSDIVVSAAGTYDIYCLESDGGYLLLQTGSGSTVPQYIFPAEDNCLYLKPNNKWNEANARFAAYFYGNGEKWVSMERVGFNGYYKVEIPAGFTNVIFCRMNPNTTDNNWNDGVKWGQTGDLTISAANNAYTMTANSWDQGTWSKITEY